MCGRMKLAEDWSELKIPCPWLEVENLTPLIPRYNIAPTDPVVTITESSEPQMKRWGLLPHWAKNTKGKPYINARAESVATTGLFKTSFAARRCLIPASGFYEWTEGQGEIKKQPYLFHGAEPVLMMAGIHRTWRQGEEEVPSCAVITGPALGPISDYHDRMPIIIRTEFLQEWLSQETSPERLEQLMKDGLYELEPVKVSTYVNSVKHQGPECSQPA